LGCLPCEHFFNALGLVVFEVVVFEADYFVCGFAECVFCAVAVANFDAVAFEGDGAKGALEFAVAVVAEGFVPERGGDVKSGR